MITIELDKLVHAFGSALGVLVVAAGGFDLLIAALVTAGIGIGREVYNLRNTGFSWADLAADAVGIAGGLVLAALLAQGACNA